MKRIHRISKFDGLILRFSVSVTIMSTPSLQEAVFNDHNPPYNEEENENTNDDAFPFDRQ